MRSIPGVLAAVSGLLFFAAFLLSVDTVRSTATLTAIPGDGQADRTYHVGLYIPDTHSAFFEQVVIGAHGASEAYDSAVAVHRLNDEDRQLRSAAYSGIDGVILYPSMDEPTTLAHLRTLGDSAIPVVLIEHSVTSEWPPTVVGTNNFDVGRRIAKLARSFELKHPNGVVVYSDKSPGPAREMDLVELGIATELGGTLTIPFARKRTGRGPRDAEQLTYHILRTMPEVNIIAFTDTADTLAAVQVLIDMNLVGEVRMIGFGWNDTIEDYLDRNILAGTILTNPNRIGGEAVRVLHGLMKDGYSSGFVDTGVELLWSTP